MLRSPPHEKKTISSIKRKHQRLIRQQNIHQYFASVRNHILSRSPPRTDLFPIPPSGPEGFQLTNNQLKYLNPPNIIPKNQPQPNYQFHFNYRLFPNFEQSLFANLQRFPHNQANFIDQHPPAIAQLPPTALLSPQQFLPQLPSTSVSPSHSIGLSPSRLESQDYKLSKKVIGSGTFSKVYLGMKMSTREQVAVKEVKRLEKNQIKCLVELASPHIVKVYSIWSEGGKSYIVLELCERNLKAELERCSYKYEVVQNYFSQIVSGMDVLFSRNVIHRDLKFENILMKDGQIKIADFGLAKFLGDDLSVQSQRCGTPYTMAPQIYFSNFRKPAYSTKSDIWSIGILLHIMLYKCHPFNSSDKLFKSQKRVSVVRKYGLLDTLIDKCLKFNPEKRIAWEQFKKIYRNQQIQPLLSLKKYQLQRDQFEEPEEMEEQKQNDEREDERRVAFRQLLRRKRELKIEDEKDKYREKIQKQRQLKKKKKKEENLNLSQLMRQKNNFAYNKYSNLQLDSEKIQQRQEHWHRMQKQIRPFHENSKQVIKIQYKKQKQQIMLNQKKNELLIRQKILGQGRKWEIRGKEGIWSSIGQGDRIYVLILVILLVVLLGSFLPKD